MAAAFLRIRQFGNRRGKRVASQEKGWRTSLTPFCPRRTRRGAENFNTFLSAEDAEGRGELQKPFLSAEDAEGRGELQKPFLSAEDAEGRGEPQHLFCPRRTRRGAENFNTFLSAEDAEGRGELQHLFVRGGRGGARRTSTPFCPRRTRRGAENFNTFLSAEDAENTLDLFELRGAVVFTLNGFGDQRCSLTRRLRSSLPWLPKLKRRPTRSPVALR